MTNRADLETDEDRAAFDLCVEVGVEPWACVPDPCSRRFAGFEGDYFMNWARERVDEFLTIAKVLLAAHVNGEQTREEQ